MEQVCNPIAEPECRIALVRRSHLAEKPGDAGGKAIGQWASLLADALAEKRIAKFFTWSDYTPCGQISSSMTN